MKGITNLGKGWYLIRFRAKDPKADREIDRSRKVRAKSLRETEAIAIQLRGRVLGDEQEARPSKLGEHAREWLKRKLEAKRADGTPRLAPATLDWYTDIVDVIVEDLGHYYVNKIASKDVEDWRDFLAESYASMTCARK